WLGHDAAPKGPATPASGALPGPSHRSRLSRALIRSLLRSAPHVTVRSADDLRAKIREVPDFPKPGILFYDITTLLKDPDAFREVIDQMADQVKDSAVDLVVGMESRGFIFSAPLAYQLHAGFVPVRKLGKLPAETIEVEYDL